MTGKEYFGHPTQKPKALIKYLIQSCSNENDIILDPFLGSGTTAKACEELNRRWVGAELEGEYITMINKRLSQQTLSNLSATPRTLPNGNPAKQESLICVKEENQEWFSQNSFQELSLTL